MSKDILNKAPSYGIHYVTRKFRSDQHIEEKVPLYATHVSEMITKTDPRYRSPEVQVAMKKEIEGIVEKGTWTVAIKSELPPGAYVLNGRFVIIIKDIGTDKALYKARYVAQGHRDKENINGSSENYRQAAVYSTSHRISSHLRLQILHP
jgi:hypothetical protein